MLDPYLLLGPLERLRLCVELSEMHLAALSTGVLLLRNSKWTRSFMDDLAAFAKRTPVIKVSVCLLLCLNQRCLSPLHSRISKTKTTHVVWGGDAPQRKLCCPAKFEQLS